MMGGPTWLLGSKLWWASCADKSRSKGLMFFDLCDYVRRAGSLHGAIVRNYEPSWLHAWPDQPSRSLVVAVEDVVRPGEAERGVVEEQEEFRVERGHEWRFNGFRA